MSNTAKLILDALKCSAVNPIFLTHHESLSGQDFLTKVETRNAKLIGRIRPGDRVLLATRNGSEYWINLLALWMRGAVAIPIDENVEATSLAKILAISNPRIFLGGFDQHGKILAAQGVQDIEALPVKSENSSGPQMTATQSSDPALINFTSGSTGAPKGVLICHGGLIGNGLATREAVGVLAGQRILVPIPFHFISALSHFLVTLTSGACFVTHQGGLLQRNLLDLMNALGADGIGTSPLHISWLADLLTNLHKPLQWVMSSGDHLSPYVIRKIKDASPDTKIYVVFGMTEQSGRICVLPDSELKTHIDTVGKPIAGTAVRVVDHSFTDVSPGEIGEVLVKSAHRMLGYDNNQEATDEAFVGDWLRTRDFGYLDATGFLTLIGRNDDVMKVSGLKVSAIPINDALLACGIFQDVVVVPTPHPLLGHVPHAFYVLKPDAVFDRATVMASLRTLLPANHLPHHFTPLPHIDRTASGKVIRKKLSQDRGLANP